MSDGKVILISTADQLLRKLRFALKLVGFEILAVPDVGEARKRHLDNAAAILIDSDTGYRAAVDFSLWRKSSGALDHPVPLILCQARRETWEPALERTVFDDVCQLPFLRLELYRLLRRHGLLATPEVRIVPFLNALPEDEVEKFLAALRESRTELVPSYENGYGYPEADRLLPGDSRDSVSFLLNLYSRGRLERRLFDRVHQCPRCATSQLNFRECCPQCHSIDFFPTEMLHHYPCGYVGDSSEFRVFRKFCG